MIKTLLTYVFVFVLLYLLGYHTHHFVLKEQVGLMPFSLQKVYIFHAIFSFFICVVLFSISKKGSMKDQLGFIYLGTFVFKLVSFATIFSALFVGDLHFSSADKASLLFPLFVFLVPEVYFIVKILGNLPSDKK